MIQLSYASKFALCVLAGAMGLALCVWSMNAQGPQPNSLAMAGLLLNLVVIMSAAAMSVIAFGASLADD